MSGVPVIALDDLMATNSVSIDPSRFSDEAFDLYSIPAFDNGRPELSLGREIGSSKQIVQPNDVLLSRIVPHIRRAWVVGEQRGRGKGQRSDERARCEPHDVSSSSLILSKRFGPIVHVRLSTRNPVPSAGMNSRY